jgi:GNAT superfamily N-acetyltransferase
MAQRLRAGPHQIIFGTFDGARLTGIAGLRREAIAVVHDKASLWGVYVASARGHGTGRQLVQAAIAHACAIPERPACGSPWRRTTMPRCPCTWAAVLVLAGEAASGGLLQLQLTLPRPAIAGPRNDVFMKINTLQVPE